MSNWFEKDLHIEGNSEEAVMEAVTLSPDNLKTMAKQMGLKVVSDDDGHYMSVPSDRALDKNFMSQFIDYWVGSSVVKQSIEQDREIRYNAYFSMDKILGEAIITLDAYADEALGVGFIEQPIDINFSDEAIGEQVMEILEKNLIISRSRSHMRNLCKWGDLGARIIPPKDSNDVTDIKIKMMTPQKWEAFFLEQGPVPLGYLENPTFGKKAGTNLKLRKEDIIQPWEFVQFTVPDDEFAPYGRSLLEAMRTSFDQLVTIEALLALSRASRVERLVVKVPTGQSNPTAAMAKINQFKSMWKNQIFSEKNKGKSSQARTPALMDMMFMPSDEGFDIDRLPAGSGVEISSTDDVEYFRNQVLMMSGLPKGYLLADETTDRYHSLAAQDLKFARKLIPYQDGYAAGLTKLCMVLAGYAGADLESLEITVKVKRPVQTSDQLLQNYEAISRASVEMIDNFKRSLQTGGEEETPVKTDPELYSKLLAYLGMPEDLVKLFDASDVNDPDFPQNSPNDDNMDKIVVNDKSGKLDDFLSQMQEKKSSICTSSKIYKENTELFTFFKGSSTSHSNVLLEALDGRIEPVITG